MNHRSRQIIIHTFCCLAFLSTSFFFAKPEDRHGLWLARGPLRDLLGCMLAVAYFYFNYFWIIPQLFFTKRRLLFIVVTLYCFIVITVIPPFVMPLAGESRALMNRVFRSHFGHNFFRLMFVCFISLMIKINERWKAAERGRINAALSYLRAQINPHFLFNTLNNIYSLAVQQSEETPTAIVQLSGMMRYMTTDSSSEIVPLEKELEYLDNYIRLQKSRFGFTTDVRYVVNGTTTGKRIAPLLLITFIENAFKYGVNPEKPSPIFIEIYTKGSTLSMIIQNRKVALLRPVDERSQTRVGLANTRYRLQVLYPGRHKLTVLEDEHTYSVTLHLDLV